MEKKDIILLRQIRYRIIEICNCIYMQTWSKVYEYWKALDTELMIIPFDDIMWYEILNQCRNCVMKGNFLRLRDLLVYEMDLYIVNQLCSLSKEIRISLANDAERENEEALRRYHKEMLELISSEDRKTRIECSYVGAENVSISIAESGGKYRLFSSVNPWLESSNLIYEMVKEPCSEIYAFGFGGGYAIRELERRFNGAKIKVYISNLDIFQAVVKNISVSTILRYEKLEFIVDPIGMVFFIDISKKIRENDSFKFYIDYQELRACTGSAYIASDMLKDSQKQIAADSILKGGIGEKIERYINGLNYDG